MMSTFNSDIHPQFRFDRWIAEVEAPFLAWLDKPREEEAERFVGRGIGRVGDPLLDQVYKAFIGFAGLVQDRRSRGHSWSTIRQLRSCSCLVAKAVIQSWDDADEAPDIREFWFALQDLAEGRDRSTEF